MTSLCSSACPSQLRLGKLTTTLLRRSTRASTLEEACYPHLQQPSLLFLSRNNPRFMKSNQSVVQGLKILTNLEELISRRRRLVVVRVSHQDTLTQSEGLRGLRVLLSRARATCPGSSRTCSRPRRYQLCSTSSTVSSRMTQSTLWSLAATNEQQGLRSAASACRATLLFSVRSCSVTFW